MSRVHGWTMTGWTTRPGTRQYNYDVYTPAIGESGRLTMTYNKPHGHTGMLFIDSTTIPTTRAWDLIDEYGNAMVYDYHKTDAETVELTYVSGDIVNPNHFTLIGVSGTIYIFEVDLFTVNWDNPIGGGLYGPPYTPDSRWGQYADATGVDGIVNIDYTIALTNVKYEATAVIALSSLACSGTGYAGVDVVSKSIGSKHYSAGTVTSSGVGNRTLTFSGADIDTLWGEGDVITISSLRYYIRARLSNTQLLIQSWQAGPVASSASYSLDRAWSTISAWESDSTTPADLVAANQVWKGVVYNDAAYSGNVTISRCTTTDARRHRILTVAVGHRHRGQLGIGAATSGRMTISEKYFTLEHLRLTHPTAITGAGFYIINCGGSGAAMYTTINSVLIHDWVFGTTASPSDGQAFSGISMGYNGGCRILNTIITGMYKENTENDSEGMTAIYIHHSVAQNKIYNCTITNITCNAVFAQYVEGYSVYDSTDISNCIGINRQYTHDESSIPSSTAETYKFDFALADTGNGGNNCGSGGGYTFNFDVHGSNGVLARHAMDVFKIAGSDAVAGNSFLGYGFHAKGVTTATSFHDGGNSWRSYNSNRNWCDIDLSQTGKYIVAVAESGQYIYMSKNYGATWSSAAVSRNWKGCAISKDGKYVTAVSNPSSSENCIYVSSDYGTTWVAATSTNAQWCNVDMSDDGHYQVGLQTSGYVYVSGDYGVTWVRAASAGSNSWRGVAVSASGQYVTVGYDGTPDGGLLISDDYGATWHAVATSAPVGNFQRISMSANGRYQTAVARWSSGLVGGFIYGSDDYGVTWTIRRQYFNVLWQALAVSEDGKTQIAAVDGGGVWESADYGHTWLGSALTKSWRGMAMSSDSMVVAAIDYGGKIYIRHNYIYMAQSDESGDIVFATVFVPKMIAGYQWINSSSYGALVELDGYTGAAFNADASTPNFSGTFHYDVKNNTFVRTDGDAELDNIFEMINGCIVFKKEYMTTDWSTLPLTPSGGGYTELSTIGAVTLSTHLVAQTAVGPAVLCVGSKKWNSFDYHIINKSAPGKINLRLKKDSPCIGAGLNLSSVSELLVDIAGNTRTTWDIGAYADIAVSETVSYIGNNYPSDFNSEQIATGRCYTTCSNWIAARGGNLVADGRMERAVIVTELVGAQDMSDTSQYYATDYDFYVQLQPAVGNPRFSINMNGASGHGLNAAYNDFARIINADIHNGRAGDDLSSMIGISQKGSNYTQIINPRVYDLEPASELTGTATTGIRISGVDGDEDTCFGCIVINPIIYGIRGKSMAHGVIAQGFNHVVVGATVYDVSRIGVVDSAPYQYCVGILLIGTGHNIKNCMSIIRHVDALAKDFIHNSTAINTSNNLASDGTALGDDCIQNAVAVDEWVTPGVNFLLKPTSQARGHGVAVPEYAYDFNDQPRGV